MNPEISPIPLESNSAPVSYPQASHRRTPSRTGSRTSCKVLA
jgi:hypothetical protein